MADDRVRIEVAFDGGQVLGALVPLSEETKAMRDHEQARLTDEAFAEAQRLLQKHRASLDRIAQALLEGIEAESRSSETVGTVRVVAAD